MGRNFLGPNVDDGQPADRWLPPGLNDQSLDAIVKVGRGERVGNFETRRVCKNGGVVDVSLTVSPIRDLSGALTGASVVARDISERKRHDQLLADESRRLRWVESVGHVGSWELDLATDAIVFSETLLEIFGEDPAIGAGADMQSSPEWAPPRPVSVDRLHPEDRDAMSAALDACRRTGEPFRLRYRVYRIRDGALIWCDVTR